MNWQRKAILFGLLIHFVLWWIFAFLFLKGLTVPFYDLLIAPIYFSILCISVWDSVIGSGVIAVICLLGFVILSLWKRKGWLVLLAHLSVVLYWCYNAFIWIYLTTLAG